VTEPGGQDGGPEVLEFLDLRLQSRCEQQEDDAELGVRQQRIGAIQDAQEAPTEQYAGDDVQWDAGLVRPLADVQ